MAINGAGLLSGATGLAVVTLASEPATITSSSNSVVAVVAAASTEAKTGDIVLIANTGAVITAGGAWQYLEEGQVSTVTPNTGQEGTFVAIAGEHLLGGGSELVSITLASVMARILNISDTNVNVQAARGGNADPGYVVLTANTGAVVTLVDGWSYLEFGAIVSATPQIAQLNTLVTIVGERFLGGGWSITRVELSGRSATIVTQSDSQVIVSAASSTGHDNRICISSATVAHSLLKLGPWHTKQRDRLQALIQALATTEHSSRSKGQISLLRAIIFPL